MVSFAVFWRKVLFWFISLKRMTAFCKEGDDMSAITYRGACSSERYRALIIRCWQAPILSKVFIYVFVFTEFYICVVNVKKKHSIWKIIPEKWNFRVLKYWLFVCARPPARAILIRCSLRLTANHSPLGEHGGGFIFFCYYTTQQVHLYLLARTRIYNYVIAQSLPCVSLDLRQGCEKSC